MKNLCLFDLDGTLADPKEGITKSYCYALSSFGISEKQENLTKYIGPPLRDVFREFYGFGASDTERAVAKYREYFSAKGLYESELYPGIAELLKKLTDGGVIMAVATSKVTLYTDKILRRLKIDGFFSFVSGDEMDGSRTKDGKRDIIKAALDALDPERKRSAVMIGDRAFDVAGAREAGIGCFGVAWGYGSREELERARAESIVNSPDELYRRIIND